MDAILKTDVDEEQIEPFMADISRYFDYIDKEDLIKKIVTREFGQFLAYYADAPEIVKPSVRESRGERGERGGRNGRRGDREKASHAPEKGYKRLFINLGKKDGFYPGEIMQFINKNMGGRQKIGHIDLLERQSYIEVPERDADKVTSALTGALYKGREVRCNDAEQGGEGNKRGARGSKQKDGGRGRGRRRDDDRDINRQRGKKDDWRQFFKGEAPDFNEEGWAMRKPRKKKQ
jgi:ATP-dependent RNA helicase DeaD